MKNKSKEIYKGQRGKEKRELFECFRLRSIEEIYKNKFFALFNNQCFKCGTNGQLDIDHHKPMILGGHLIPGNLVALCKRCNNKKHDFPPDKFYTPEELNRLKPILGKQIDLFDFAFDWNYWNQDRKGYLLSLGVESNLVHELLHNPDHPDYRGLPTHGIGIVISSS